MSELHGLLKHPNNPACTKSVSLNNTELGHNTEEEKDDEEEEKIRTFKHSQGLYSCSPQN